ncbi:MAG: hypothetical protein R2838_25125 [Caldilineaceae bacterium]
MVLFGGAASARLRQPPSASRRTAVFVPGANVPVLRVGAGNVGTAICYELSASPLHAATAVEQEAALCGGVAKSTAGVTGAHRQLGEIAARTPCRVDGQLRRAERRLRQRAVRPPGTQPGQRRGSVGRGMQGIVSYDTATDACRCTQI